MDPYDDPDGDGIRPDGDCGADMITMSPPRWQRWRPGRPIAVMGVVAAALAGGAGVGYAATHSVSKPAADTAAMSAASKPTPIPSATAPQPTPPGRGFRSGAGYRFGPLWIGGFGGLVHGQFTAPKSGGGYQTVDVQRGTVTAVSATSVTVKSADGYSLTYTVTSKTLVDAQAAGIGSVKKGDSVIITATVSGSTPTAADIIDLTAMQAGRAAFGFPAKPLNPAQGMPAQPPSA